MNTFFEFHVPSSTHWIHLKNILPLHWTLGTWCSHPSPSPLNYFEIQKMLKHFTFVFYEVDPHLPCVVINETHVVLASFNGFCLCGPHIWVDHFQRFGTYMNCLSWEWMPNLLPQLACFTNFWHSKFKNDEQFGQVWLNMTWNYCILLTSIMGHCDLALRFPPLGIDNVFHIIDVQITPCYKWAP